MEDLIILRHIHLHFVNWQQRQRISEQIVYWVKEVLDGYIKDDWRVPIRFVNFIRF